MKIRVAMIAGLAAVAVAGVVHLSFAADASVCRRGQTYVPNWGCLSNRVIAQAKYNCRTGPAHTSKWSECLCQDGSLIGACGK
jgi:hypothetical protein